MSPSPELQQTPLHAVHRASGARMVDFGGWDMPVQYSGILEEHHAVRRAVGLFDVSHMGEIEISGPQAFDLVNYAATSAVAKMAEGQAQYAGLLYDHGGFVDDILIYKVTPTHYFLCVNASNQEKDFEHIAALQREKGFDCAVDFASPRYAQLAVQGPLASAVVQQLTPVDLKSIRYYRFADGEVMGVAARIARTGYTGEDCFELFVSPEHAVALWNKLLEAGAPHGIKPCGLGARNTLRLEAGMALYGHEISATINPVEAGLLRNIDLNKDFTGKPAVVRCAETGPTRKLCGIEMTGRGIARDGYEMFVDGAAAGWVTSGSPSPTLNKNIAMCYLPVSASELGRTVQVLIRGQQVDAVTVPLPFYKRAK
ncbi:MAG: glycine cleavage system aminomethyltransferase GcvT [Bryobacterales bacterium]|nr:glycine cleavage system aminomethyltransferase GcvT [Bryobacterales bacterium]